VKSVLTFVLLGTQKKLGEVAMYPERGAGEAGRKSFCSPGTREQNRTGELPFPTLDKIALFLASSKSY